MVGIVSKPDTHKKLRILSADAQYDLACACGTGKDEHRARGRAGWIYPVTLPNGGTSVLFKTLISNVCTNDCSYCPLRENQDMPRCSLTVEETANAFLDYYNRGEVFGLFLSSSVIGSPDATMDRLCGIASLLRRRHKYRGYIHLKIIPGCSPAAVEKAVSLSTAVSLNIETPGAKYLDGLSKKKNFLRDIIEPIKLISRLTAKGNRYQRVKQTTQFIVAAAGESDAEIVKYTWGLYKRLNLNRVYFSAYQKALGDQRLLDNNDGSTSIFTREHRLYQADFLIRKYGFTDKDIICNNDGNLSLEADPKQIWADNHPEAFPVNANHASKYQLLRVPGLGPVTVGRIINHRCFAKLHRIEDVARPNAVLRKAAKYLVF